MLLLSYLYLVAIATAKITFRLLLAEYPLTLQQLSKYPALNNFEKQTSVPKVYAFLGLVGIYFFLVFFNIAGEFLVNFAGFVIPGYYSLEALFSASKVDDTQVCSIAIYRPAKKQ